MPELLITIFGPGSINRRLKNESESIASNTSRKGLECMKITMKSILAFILIVSSALISATNRDEFDNEASKNSTKFQNKEKLVRQERSDFGDVDQNIFSRFGKKPKKKHLDRDYLMQLMGNSYDSERLSEEEPAVLTYISPIPLLDEVTSFSSWSLQHTYNELMKLNLAAEISKSDVNITETVNIMRQWLFQKAVCPIHFTWKDIGPYFWPRWLKIGECDDSKIACSWPPGMHCIPAETSTVQVLRWHCSGFGHRGKKHRSALKKASSSSSRSRKNWRKSVDGDKKCQWIKVPYPVISSCICQC